MASYKQPCAQCGTFIDRDVRLCPACGSASPFGFHCPSCLHAIEKAYVACPGCGRPLVVACPHCGKDTFVQEKCEQCGQSLMATCRNSRCGVPQFFQNTKCTACGKKLKSK